MAEKSGGLAGFGVPNWPGLSFKLKLIWKILINRHFNRIDSDEDGFIYEGSINEIMFRIEGVKKPTYDKCGLPLMVKKNG